MLKNIKSRYLIELFQKLETSTFIINLELRTFTFTIVRNLF